MTLTLKDPTPWRWWKQLWIGREPGALAQLPKWPWADHCPCRCLLCSSEEWRTWTHLPSLFLFSSSVEMGFICFQIYAFINYINNIGSHSFYKNICKIKSHGVKSDSLPSASPILLTSSEIITVNCLVYILPNYFYLNLCMCKCEYASVFFLICGATAAAIILRLSCMCFSFKKWLEIFHYENIRFYLIISNDLSLWYGSTIICPSRFSYWRAFMVFLIFHD